MFFNEKVGFTSGLKLTEFETTYKLLGDFRNPERTYDPNNTEHIDSVRADLDSTVTLQYLGIPLAIKYIYDINNKFSLFVNAGLNISFLYSSKYKLTGDEFYNFGFYELNDPLLQEISFTELGFRNVSYTPPITGKPNVKSLNILGEISIGITIKTGYYSSIQLGPKFIFGLTSVTDSDNYIDIFSRPLESKPTKTNNIGFEISYIRKI